MLGYAKFGRISEADASAAPADTENAAASSTNEAEDAGKYVRAMYVVLARSWRVLFSKSALNMDQETSNRRVAFVHHPADKRTTSLAIM